MQGGKVLHAVLQVTHVAEEVFGELGRGLDGSGSGEGWAAETALPEISVADVNLRLGMPCNEAWYHDEEEASS